MPEANKVQAKVTHRFDASQEDVYDAWLDPEIIRSWMSRQLAGMGGGEIERVETDARIGGRFLFSDRRPQGLAEHWGSYIDLQRPHRIVFSWIGAAEEEDDPSIVTIIILPHPESGAVVTLTHDMDARRADEVPQTERSWAGMLGAIEAVLDEQDVV